jgi:predicted flavoprotein YhiN
MAGKSGLNLTKDEAVEAALGGLCGGGGAAAPMLRAFGPAEVQAWARGLGQEVFTGSSGRVFPVAMKASPLLRAWMGRLGALGRRAAGAAPLVGWEDGGFEVRHAGGARRRAARGGGSGARRGELGAIRV